MNPKIFISYSWLDIELVNIIDTDFKNIGIELIRDTKDVPYGKSIKKHIQSIRNADYVLLVISTNYLYSQNCLYEIIELFKEQNYDKKVLSIILPNTNIFKPLDWTIFIKYWQNKRIELETSIQEITIESTSELTNELKKYREICNTISTFLEFISSNNYLSYESLKISNYSEILNFINFEAPDLANQLIGISIIKDEELLDIQIDEFIFKNPLYKSGLLFKANIEFKRGNYLKMRHLLHKLIESNNSDANLYSLMALANKNLKNYPLALKDLNNAIDISPNYLNAIQNRGNLYYQLGEIELANLDFIRSLKLDINPTPVEFCNRAIIKKNCKDYIGAIDDCNSALAIDPNNIDALRNLALIKYDINEFNDSLELINIVLSKEINSEDLSTRGSIHKYLNFKKEAMDDYNLSIQINPNNEAAYNNRGNLHKANKDYVQAIDDFSKAIMINELYSDAYSNRGTVFSKLKNYNAAMIDYNKAIEINKFNAMAFCNRATLKSYIKDFKGMLEDYDIAVSLENNNDYIYMNRGVGKFENGDIDGAINDLKYSLQINDKNAYAYFALGNVYNNISQKKLSLENYQKSFELSKELETYFWTRVKSGFKLSNFLKNLFSITNSTTDN